MPLISHRSVSLRRRIRTRIDREVMGRPTASHTRLSVEPSRLDNRWQAAILSCPLPAGPCTFAPRMLHRDVTPGVHWIEDVYVNWYLLADGNNLTIVDTGLPRSWDSLQSALK